MKKTFLTSFLSLTLFFALGLVIISAQTNTGDNNAPVSNSVTVTAELTNPFNVGTTLYEVLEAVITNIILPIGGVLAVLAFIFSGFLYVTAQGNESKIKTAHQALLYTSVGTAVLLGSWVIAKVIEATINQLK